MHARFNSIKEGGMFGGDTVKTYTMEGYRVIDKTWNGKQLKVRIELRGFFRNYLDFDIA